MTLLEGVESAARVARILVANWKPNSGVWRSMMQAGTPCPYKGKIGEEAKIAWENNPEDRPDWNEIKADYKSHDFRAYKKEDFCKKYSKHKICTK